MDEECMDVLLIGKTGHGKSFTGNSLLNKNSFKKSGNTSSETKDVKSDMAQVGRYKLNVVDGPGLEDTDLDKVKDKEAAATNMDFALALCAGSVNAFLYVIRYGIRLTDEDKTAFDACGKIFGDSFMRHVIIVMTGGDHFSKEMEDDSCNDSFDEWCRKQKGIFQQMYVACEERAVLIDNFEKNEEKKREQTQKIVQLMKGITTLHGCYTSDLFEIAETKRGKMLLELGAPQFIKEFNIEIVTIISDIQAFTAASDGSEIEDRIRECLLTVREKVERTDNGHGILSELLNQIKNLESYLDDTHELKQLKEGSSKVKVRQKRFARVGQVLCHGAVMLARVAVKASLPLYAVAAIGSEVVSKLHSYEIKKKEKRIQALQDNLQKNLLQAMAKSE